jgi:hypothetical protein
MATVANLLVDYVPAVLSVRLSGALVEVSHDHGRGALASKTSASSPARPPFICRRLLRISGKLPVNFLSENLRRP